MITIKQTKQFGAWLSGLKDKKTRLIIAGRIDRMERGLPGDTKSVGGDVSELRIHYGKGYRVYYTRRGGTIVILLCGGDKSSQSKDISKAQKLSKEVDEKLWN
ncbi:MAG: type II toxin-antitoxin system RelE/ParE family toxin [Sneathiella sp.]